VELADEPPGADERLIASGVCGEAVSAARLPGGIDGHLPIQIGHHLAVSLDAEDTGCTGKAHALQMTEVLVDRR
jgi:hypothetical protein